MKANPQPDPNPCKECGGESRCRSGSMNHQIVCKCGNKTEWFNDYAKAILAWNEENPREGK